MVRTFISWCLLLCALINTGLADEGPGPAGRAAPNNRANDHKELLPGLNMACSVRRRFFSWDAIKLECWLWNQTSEIAVLEMPNATQSLELKLCDEKGTEQTANVRLGTDTPSFE